MKRTRDVDEIKSGSVPARKKQRKGFSVGPANLPDGTHRRKVQQIKQGLIENAKIRKQYEKVKRQERARNESTNVAATVSEDVDHDTKEDKAVGKMHADVIGYKNGNEEEHEHQNLGHFEHANLDKQQVEGFGQMHPSRRQRPMPFTKEARAAAKRKQEIESRQQARIEADRQRQEKLEERERFCRAMAKARTGGKNGQRKLGRESTVLLERVKRMVG